MSLTNRDKYKFFHDCDERDFNNAVESIQYDFKTDYDYQMNISGFYEHMNGPSDNWDDFDN